MYKLKKCVRCGKEFIPNKNVQKYCKECTHIAYTEGMREYHKEHSSKEGYKPKICKRCRKEFKPTSSTQKYCKECRPIIRNQHERQYNKRHAEQERQYTKQYQLEHFEHVEQHHKQWQKDNPQKVKGYYKKHLAKRRQLDFIPLNKSFKNSVAHHLDRIYIIYIPIEIHKSIWHSVLKNYNMDEINAIAFNYI